MRARNPAGALRPSANRSRRAGLLVATLFAIPAAFAQDAAEWLQHAATAARTLNYVGTITYQHDGRMETSRLAHFTDANGEYEKLTNLDGPTREVIRSNDQVRCYYSDMKMVRIEPQAFHNVFPALVPQQLATLTAHYYFRKAEIARIAGLETQAYIFEPKDGMRYGHKFWADSATGLLLKARLINERNEPIEQFAFSDIQIGAKLDRDMLQAPFPAPPPDWQVRESLPGDVVLEQTGWIVKDLPPGFAKVTEGYRTLRGKPRVAHLVFSDGLVAVSVFVEPTPAGPQQVGLSQQGAFNLYARPLDEHLVTVVGEAPGATVRQIAHSVSHR
jgi:sigma-E factor negative regulatory protein RseB